MVYLVLILIVSLCVIGKHIGLFSVVKRYPWFSCWLVFSVIGSYAIFTETPEHSHGVDAWRHCTELVCFSTQFPSACKVHDGWSERPVVPVQPDGTYHFEVALDVVNGFGASLPYTLGCDANEKKVVQLADHLVPR
jgi:hypothetical protein